MLYQVFHANILRQLFTKVSYCGSFALAVVSILVHISDNNTDEASKLLGNEVISFHVVPHTALLTLVALSDLVSNFVTKVIFVFTCVYTEAIKL